MTFGPRKLAKVFSNDFRIFSATTVYGCRFVSLLIPAGSKWKKCRESNGNAHARGGEVADRQKSLFEQKGQTCVQPSTSEKVALSTDDCRTFIDEHAMPAGSLRVRICERCGGVVAVETLENKGPPGNAGQKNGGSRVSASIGSSICPYN